MNKVELGLLEDYYENRFRIEKMPDFNDLTAKQKNMIADTIGFAGYRLSYYLKQCSIEAKEALKRSFLIKLKYKENENNS